jgi:hypothetical protein
VTGATSGLLVVRKFVAQDSEPEQLRLFDLSGKSAGVEHIRSYAHSLAAAISSMAPECVLTPLAAARNLGSVRFSAYEASRQHLLGVALLNQPSLTVVLELFDKSGGGPFTLGDRESLVTLHPVAAALLGCLLGERESQRMLYDTLGAALRESEAFAGTLAAAREAAPAARQVFRECVKSAGAVPGVHVDAWAEVLQRLSERYGPGAAERALELVRHVESMLADATGLSPQ